MRVDDHASDPIEHEIFFGPFRLLPGRRLLLECDKPVQIGSRALDLLIALIEHHGELVSKRELIAKVRRHTFVAEAISKSRLLRSAEHWQMVEQAFDISLPLPGLAIVLLHPLRR